jgi:glutamyl-tRNA(Gln) amidotransferase subunit E
LDVNYSEIGLKVGLEIHRQLKTKTKLFCNCEPNLFKEEPEIMFLRTLRPTQSELGQIDSAAYFEFQKGVKILYEANTETSCLVEMDEEPPHPLDMEAVETTLLTALMMNAKPVDEINVMRKTVIDGSNTTGFQRTCIIALNGEIKVGEKKIQIEHVSLEEDAARKIISDKKGKSIRYRIDRLGIPLIEVATAPVIYSPKETEEVALAIGKILKATGKVKRGLGSIRQDVNISISEGALVEIKGVQELELLHHVVEYEVLRQLSLIAIREKLNEIGVKEEEIHEEIFDVTPVFNKTRCQVLLKAINKKNKIFALKLPKFRGLLKWELLPNYRFGKEMADRARFWGRVGGIFHTDELPAYGITETEVTKLKKSVKANKDDAVIFVASSLENAKDALKAVVVRAREALKGIPEETRAAESTGKTYYMRPRPGSARMYPETDIPQIQLTDDYIEKIRSKLPEPPQQKLKRLQKKFNLNQKLAKQIMDSDNIELFETIINENEVSPTTVAVFFTETLKALNREGIRIEKVTEKQMKGIFKNLSSGKITKEALVDIVVWLSKHESRSVSDAIKELNLEIISKDELEKIITNLIKENKQVITTHKDRAFGIIMGIAMKKVRGKAKAKLVSDVIRTKLETQIH